MPLPVTKSQLTDTAPTLGKNTFQKLKTATNNVLQIFMQTVFSYRVVESITIVSLTYITPCMSAGYLLFYAVSEYCTIFKIKVSYKYAARRGGNLAAVVCGVLRRLRPRTS